MGILLKDAVRQIEHDDLLKMMKDIEKGGLQMRKILQDQIAQNEKRHDVNCATCSSAIDPDNSRTFTLMFGPPDFRKRATFCAHDCLEFFIEKLKALK